MRASALPPPPPILVEGQVFMDQGSAQQISGTIQVDSEGGLRFAPSSDAEAFGHRPFQVPLQKIREIYRLEGNRIRVGAEKTWFFRGHTAVIVWMVLHTFCEARTVSSNPAFLSVTLQFGNSSAPGVLAIGASGLGFGAPNRPNNQASGMIPLEAIQKLTLHPAALQIQYAGGSLQVGTSHAEDLQEILVGRWHRCASAHCSDTTWSCLAVRRNAPEVALGHLGVTPTGLCWIPQGGGTPEVLIARNQTGVAQPVEDTPGLIEVGVEGAEPARFYLENVAQGAAEIQQLLRAKSWSSPPVRGAVGTAEISGLAQRIQVTCNKFQIAQGDEVSFLPDGLDVSLQLEMSGPTPSFPSAVQLEILIHGSLYLQQGTLTAIQPGVEPGRMLLKVTLVGPPKPVNKREYFRLPARELINVRLLSSARVGAAGALTTGGILLDISRTGLGVWLPVRPLREMVVQSTLVVPAIVGDLATSKTHEIRGNIVWIADAVYNRQIGWRIGIRFDVDCDGAAAFEARQRRFLQQRRDILGK